MRPEIKKIIENEVITIQEVARMLNVNTIYIYRYLTEEGICDYAVLGKNRIVIDKEDIKLLEARFYKNRKSLTKRYERN